MFTTPAEYDQPGSRWKTLWLVVAVSLGVVRAWIAREVMDPGGIAFLDMSDAVKRGDWSMVVNGYWQPLYAGLLALGKAFGDPPPAWEASFVHGVNLVIYLGALWSFVFFWDGLIRLHRERARVARAQGQFLLPVWSLECMGYGWFVWSALDLITVDRVTPDLTVAAIIYTAAGLLVRIRMTSADWALCVLLGVTLGLGYLTKAALWPLSFIFLCTAALACQRPWQQLRCFALASGIFLLVCSPLIVALSLSKGRLTFSDTGALVYAWFVNDVTKYAHWQGEAPGRGTPQHPTRKLMDQPVVFEFGHPVGGTHPVWYDPSYWYEGLETHFDLMKQVRALFEGIKVYYQLFLRVQAEGVVLLLLLYVGRGVWRWRNLFDLWMLLVPGVAGFGMYLLIHTEPRFIGAFLVLVLAALFGAVRLPNTPESRSVVTGTSIIVTLLLLVRLTASTVQGVISRHDTWQRPHWQIAQALHAMGVQRGDRVGSLGYGFTAYWARLAGVRVIAEVPEASVNDFWAAPETQRHEVLQAFASVGVRAIVAHHIPPATAAAGWHRIGPGSEHVRLLQSSPTSHAPDSTRDTNASVPKR